MEMRRLLSLFVCCWFIGYACSPSQKGGGGNSNQQQQTNVNTVFSDKITDFEVGVYYESGAEPYVGNLGLTANQTWDITKASYVALFQNHPGRTVTVPQTLAEMNLLPDQGKTTWTAEELISLGEQNSSVAPNNQKVTVKVIFLNGTYNGDTNILGIHFTGHLFAFVFKDIVVSAGGDSVSQRYVEQATVVHELGHVVGFMNNGVPMVADHEDKSHPHHSTNSECVMYWTVESSQNILSSLTNFIFQNKLNLFGPETLQDGQAFHQ